MIEMSTVNMKVVNMEVYDRDEGGIIEYSNDYDGDN